MPGGRRSMELAKWYLDVATPDGRCAIVYAARLRLAGLPLHLHGVLLRGAAGTRSRWSLQPARPPRQEGTRVRYASPSLGVNVRIDAVDPPFRARLLAGPAGDVDWECRVPRGEAEIRVGGETLRGLAYAERLHASIPPWALPIRELRWGRLLSRAGGLVWISWEGAAPLRLALRDGRPATLDSAGDGEVSVDGFTHPLLPVATLREAPLSRTLPAALRRALPRVGLGLSETKWLARGAVGGAEGLAIHEVVRWP